MEEKLMKMVVKANLGCLKARSRVEKKLRDNSGAAFVDTLIGILIVVVIGAAILTALRGFIVPFLEDTLFVKIKEMFSSD
ncbi:MAG: DUF6133 family protein [Ruminococcus sp.]|nr:DUF6133 family protein [Ruminococcus sp.]